MFVECPVCNEECSKLKVLPCKHSFCKRCLVCIRQHHHLKCPLCRAPHDLGNAGIEGLKWNFSNKVSCANCKAECALDYLVWCVTCHELICSPCASKHDGHKQETADELGVIKFGSQQLDELCANQATIASVQKQSISTYLRALEKKLHQVIDDDFTDRVTQIKTNKYRLQEHFDLPSNRLESPPVSKADNHTSAVKFNAVISQLLSLDPTWKYGLGLHGKHRPTFNLVGLDDIANQLIRRDPIPKLSTNLSDIASQLNLESVHSYIGAGKLQKPSDIFAEICDGAEYIWIASPSGGIYHFDGRGCLKDHRPSPQNVQYSSLAYDSQNRKLYTVSLINYASWNMECFDANMNQVWSKLLPCPDDVVISNSWHRWIRILNEENLLISAGDETESILWVYKIESESWSVVHQEKDSTFRDPTVKKSGNYYMIYVPDMKNRRVITLAMSMTSLTIKSASTIQTDEMLSDMPIMVFSFGEKLFFGFWLTGSIVMAKLDQGKSNTVCKVGERNLGGIFVTDKTLYVLCKKTEMVQVYKL